MKGSRRACLLLAAVLMAAFMPSAFAEPTADGNPVYERGSFRYVLEGGTARIAEYIEPENVEEIITSDIIGGYTVTALVMGLH